jgi:hypothetical protein
MEFIQSPEGKHVLSISDAMKRSFELRDCLCLHGSISSKAFTDPLFIVVYTLQVKIAEIIERTCPVEEKINTFYSELIHFCVDSPLDAANTASSQILFAASVEAVHANEQEQAKRFYDAGAFLEGFHADGSGFIQSFLSDEVSKPPSFDLYLSTIQGISSRESLTTLIREKIPCDCLSDTLLRSYSDRYDWPSTWSDNST